MLLWWTPVSEQTAGPCY